MQKKVVILGGGVAGMSAAHELIERGYAVEVYDRNTTYVGGKARSIDYFGDPNKPYPTPLPGEHGFRFFPGFYKHIIDTMKRIPFNNNGKQSTVYDNLTPTSRIMIARYGMAPIVANASFPKSLADLEVLMKDIFGTNTGLTKEEEKFFAERTWQLMTSCTLRRNNDYERLGWWQYLEADRFSDTYRSLLVEGLTRTLVAARAETASTKTGGDIFLQLLFCMTNPAINTDRVLDGPTNDRWLNPWLTFLQSKGVQYHLGNEVVAININKSEQVTSATVMREDKSTFEVTGDYFILATPVERAAALISDEMVKADATLQYIRDLAPSVSWMNGIQFYLNEEVVLNNGHIICCDSEWAVTCISQIQFWDDFDITTRGNGKVKGLLSVDISDWFAPGKFTTTLHADDCNAKQIKDEVWAQLCNSINVDGQVILRDDMLVDWYLDRDICPKTTIAAYEDGNPSGKRIFDLLSVKNDPNNKLQNIEPLLVNNVNTWNLRPDANCEINNLFFAADYVRTFTDLATMEGANEAARRAVNCLLDADKSNTEDCTIWDLEEPLFLEPMKLYDQSRWKKGLPWTMHIPLWLKITMVFWSAFCLVEGFVKLIIKKIFPDNADLNADKRRAWFILGSMPIAIGCLVLAAWKYHGWEGAAWWGYGFSGLYLLYAILFNDKILLRFLLFSAAAGFTELLPDNWLVNVTHTLFYPPNEPMLYASPAYMPFSWIVVLTQIGYIGFLINKKYNLLITSLIVGLLGCMIIPLYEYLAIHAEWWHYENAPMWGVVPIYIFIAEGLLMLTIPDLFDRCETIALKWVPILGIIQGLVMWLACIIAFYFIG